MGSVTLGNGATYNGASIASAVGPVPLIDSTVAGVAGADPTKLALCYSTVDNAGVAVLDPAKVAGKIVLCDLAPATKYLGSVAYSGVSGLPNPTIVRVDTP